MISFPIPLRWKTLWSIFKYRFWKDFGRLDDIWKNLDDFDASLSTKSSIFGFLFGSIFCEFVYRFTDGPAHLGVSKHSNFRDTWSKKYKNITLLKSTRPRSFEEKLQETVKKRIFFVQDDKFRSKWGYVFGLLKKVIFCIFWIPAQTLVVWDAKLRVF